MKKFVLLIIIFLTTGCYNYNELNDLALIGAVAVDYQNSEYIVGLEMIIGSKNDRGNSVTTNIIEGRGLTLADAITNASKNISKRLYLSQISILIVSDNYAKKGLNDIIDYVIRNPEIRDTLQLVVTPDNPLEILSLTDDEADIVSQKIETIINNKDFANNINVRSTLGAFTKNLLTAGIDSYTMSVNVNQNKKIEIGGIAIFNGDKLTEIINLDNSRNLNLLNNNLVNGSYTFKCDSSNYTSIIAYNNTSEITVNENKEVDVNVTIFYKLSEDNCHTDINAFNEVDKLNQITSNYVKGEITKTLYTIQNTGSDIFGIGRKYYLQYYKFIKESDVNGFMNKVNFNITVSAKLTKDGTLINTIQKGDIYE